LFFFSPYQGAAAAQRDMAAARAHKQEVDTVLATAFSSELCVTRRRLQIAVATMRDTHYNLSHPTLRALLPSVVRPALAAATAELLMPAERDCAAAADTRALGYEALALYALLDRRAARALIAELFAVASGQSVTAAVTAPAVDANVDVAAAAAAAGDAAAHLASVRGVFDLLLAFPGLLPTTHAAAPAAAAAGGGGDGGLTITAIVSELASTFLHAGAGDTTAADDDDATDDDDDEDSDDNDDNDDGDDSGDARGSASAVRNATVDGVMRLLIMDRCEGGVDDNNDDGIGNGGDDDAAAVIDVLKPLLLLAVDPRTAGDAALRQRLSVFFPAYAAATGNATAGDKNGNGNGDGDGNAVDGHRSALLAAVFPCLRAIAAAPASTPLADVSPASLLRYVVSLLDDDNDDDDDDDDDDADVVDNSASDGAAAESDDAGAAAVAALLAGGDGRIREKRSFHARLAFATCYHLLAAPTAPEAKALCSVFSLLRLSPRAPLTTRALLLTLDSVRIVVTDRAARKALDASITHVRAIADNGDAEDGEDGDDDPASRQRRRLTAAQSTATVTATRNAVDALLNTALANDAVKPAAAARAMASGRWCECSCDVLICVLFCVAS
jgi:hypothetical protein